MLKFTMLFSVACLAHATISPDDIKKLQIADTELGVVISTTNLAIKQVLDQVTKDIDNYDDIIAYEVKQFVAEVAEAEREAEVSGKDIDICVKVAKAGAEELGYRDVELLTNCQTLLENKKIAVSVAELKALHNVIIHGRTKCNKVTDSTKCVDSTIEAVVQESTALKSNIKDVLSSIESLKCVENTYNSIEELFTAIKTSWTQCCN